MSVIILAVCMVAIVLASVFIGFNFGVSAAATEGSAVPVAAVDIHDELADAVIASDLEEVEETQEVEQDPEPAPVSGSIAVPGFDRLTAEGQFIRDIGLANPSQNNCYFIVSLALPDGSEIYRSGILKPGQPLGNIHLSRQLEPGTYEKAVARYYCYSFDDVMQPLNGADITFTLEVLP